MAARITRTLYSFYKAMQNPYQSPTPVTAAPENHGAAVTIQEFNAEAQRWSGRLTRRILYLTLFDLLALAAFLSVVFLCPAGISWMAIALMMAFFAVSHVIFQIQLNRTYREYPMLFCYNCDSNLLTSKSIVIATGNCHSCGRKVIHDDSIGR